MRKTILFCVFSALLLSFGICVKAGEITRRAVASSEINNKSIYSTLASLNDDINKLDDFSTDDSVKYYKEQIEMYEKQYSGLKNGLYISDEMSSDECLAKADEVKFYIAGLKYSLAQYEYQHAENQIYADFSDRILIETNRNNMYDLYEMMLEYSQKQHYLSYLKNYRSVIDEKISVEKTKVESGYAMQLSVDSLESEKSIIDADIIGCRNEIKYIESTVMLMYGSEMPVVADDEFDNPVIDVTKKNFSETLYHVDYYSEKIENIETYISNLEKIISETEDYIKGSTGQDKSIESALIEDWEKKKATINAQILLQKKTAEEIKSESELYTKNVELYILKMYGDLESVTADIVASEKSISVAKEKIRVNSELLDSGMITPLELSESKLELVKLNYEKYTSECRKNMIQYRIVNIIYK